MVHSLEKVGMLTALDETAMVNYVVAYDRFRRAQEVIQAYTLPPGSRGRGLSSCAPSAGV